MRQKDYVFFHLFLSISAKKSDNRAVVPPSPAGGQSDVCRGTLPLCYHASALCHWSLLCTGGENRFPVQDAGCGTLKSFIYNP